MTLETEGRKREPLKVKTVEAAGPREKDYKLPDAGGLYLFVSTSGHRSWRYKYRFGGKERRLVLGSFPDVGLKQARDMRDDAKQALRQGLDPGLERTRARHSRKVGHEHTFEKFAREWHATQIPRWKPVHADDVIKSMEQSLFPEIGGIPCRPAKKPACRPSPSNSPARPGNSARQHSLPATNSAPCSVMMGALA